MRRIKNLLILFLPVLILVILCIFSVLSKRIAKNPAGTVGNTAGNLNNGGLFCEDDGIVYFSNSYDNGCLYSMNPDETDCKKLSNASVSSLNAAGKYLYYYQGPASSFDGVSSMFHINGVYRMKKNGTNAVCLKQIPSPVLSLCDNTIFYLANPKDSGSVLWRIDTDKKNPAEITDYIANPACVHDGLIYFGGMQKDHFLYTLNPADNTITPVFEGNVYNPIVYGDYVYYMDVSSDYRLCRYHLTEQSVSILTEDRLDFYNIAGDMIYYQKSSSEEPALKRMQLDGSQNEIVAPGVYEHINATSQYVYFNAYQADTPIYRTPLYGPVSVSEFSAAEAAALRTKD